MVLSLVRWWWWCCCLFLRQWTTVAFNGGGGGGVQWRGQLSTVTAVGLRIGDDKVTDGGRQHLTAVLDEGGRWRLTVAMDGSCGSGGR